MDPKSFIQSAVDAVVQFVAWLQHEMEMAEKIG